MPKTRTFINHYPFIYTKVDQCLESPSFSICFLFTFGMVIMTGLRMLIFSFHVDIF